MTPEIDETTKKIFDSAFKMFSHHGFKRTNMSDIAGEAGIARATLYARFKQKNDIYEALANYLVDDIMSKVYAAFDETKDFSQNLVAATLAKNVQVYRMFIASANGDEILAADSAIVDKAAERLKTEFKNHIAKLAQGNINLKIFKDEEDFAEFIELTTAAFKHTAKNESELIYAIEKIVALVSLK